MKLTLPNKLTRLEAHWEMLAVTAVLFVLVIVFVDLRPVVEENFFFSTSDPAFGQEKKVEEHFPSEPDLLLVVSPPDISAPQYLTRMQKLTQRVESLDGVTAVKSLSNGPKNVQDALASPFWSRLL